MKFYFTFFTEVKNSINWSEKEEFANEPNGLGEKKKTKTRGLNFGTLYRQTVS